MDLPKRIYTGPEVRRLYEDLQRAEVGGGGSVEFGSPISLLYGGANSDGVLETAARADHRHALPTFPAGSVWDARVIPAGLHASSDPFTADTLGSGAWTEWDHGGWQTATVNTTKRRLELSGTGNGAVRWAGVRKAIPSNTFAVLAYVSFDGVMGAGGTGNPYVGLAVFQDAADSAADFGCIEWDRVANDSDWPMRLRTSIAYDGATSIDTRSVYDQPTGRWMLLCVDINPGIPTTTISGGWSSDGCNWNEFRSQAGASSKVGAWAAQHFGIAYLQLPAVASKVCVEYFRVFDGATFATLPRNGGYLI
jgi:hypothetical protein